MRRSPAALKARITSCGPPGNRRCASPGASERSRAPASMAVQVQPSKGTWRSAASSRLPRCRASVSAAASTLSWSSAMALNPLFWPLFRLDAGGVLRVVQCQAAAELAGEGEQREVGHALRVEQPVEVVAFVLHDAGVEARRLALQRRPLQGEAAVADAGEARHLADQIGRAHV